MLEVLLYEDVTLRGAENSEVLPPGPVVVAVTFRLAGTARVGEKAKPVTPLALVVTIFWPINVLPSSPDGSEKKRMTNVALGVLLRVPRTVVVPSDVVAEVRVGLFCRLFGPVSGSCVSLAVGPSSFRSIPRPALEKIEF